MQNCIAAAHACVIMQFYILFYIFVGYFMHESSPNDSHIILLIMYVQWEH